MSFEQRVWQEMSKVNVNDRTHKKGNLTYLSWADCWDVLATYYPESSFEFGDTVTYPDESVEVWAAVTIKSGDSQFTRKMPLPVMDHRNMAIKSPSSRQVSDARMRCLVKAVGVATGLGLYLYRGESLPEVGDEAPAISNPAPAKLEKPQGFTAAATKRYLKAINEIIDDPQGDQHDPFQIFQELLVDPEAPQGKRQFSDEGKWIRQEFIDALIEKNVTDKDDQVAFSKAKDRWDMFLSIATNQQ